MVRGNQLTINYVDETDNGKYTCHAYNEFDKKGAKTEYNLNVIGNSTREKFDWKMNRYFLFSSTSFITNCTDGNQFR